MTTRTHSQRAESSADVSPGDLRPSRLPKRSRPCSTAVDAEEEDDDPVEKLLEGFAKKSLVLLAKEAVSKYPDLIERVRKLAVVNPALRKIAVTDLTENINAKSIVSVFGEFGEIEDFLFKRISRRMAYILFKRRSGALRALKEPYKVIDNTLTHCMLASLQSVTCLVKSRQPPLLEQQEEEQQEEEEEEEPIEKLLEAFGVEYLRVFNNEAVSKYPNLIETVHRLADVDPQLRRVFVDNLIEFTTMKTLETFFGQFGEIEEIQVGIEEGFIRFKNRHVARKLLKHRQMKADFGTDGFIIIFPSLMDS